MELVIFVALSGLATTLGTLGGIGGAILLVPALVLLGLEPVEAAPLGLLAVAAASLAAGSRQIDQGLVNHRLGVAVEVAASSGAVAGALAAGALPEPVLRAVLAAVALASAGASFLARPATEVTPAGFAAETSGEWPGTLGGTYAGPGGIVAYQAQRVAPSLVVMAGAGAVAGVSGTSGGFIKTPTMTFLMEVPVKVAGATTTFVSGITAAAALLVRLATTGLAAHEGAAVIVGALAGGELGARLQSRAPGRAVRMVLGTALALAAVALVVT